MFQLCACHSDIPQYNSSETFRNVPLLLSHVCLCAVRFDGYDSSTKVVENFIYYFDNSTLVNALTNQTIPITSSGTENVARPLLGDESKYVYSHTERTDFTLAELGTVGIVAAIVAIVPGVAPSVIGNIVAYAVANKLHGLYIIQKVYKYWEKEDGDNYLYLKQVTSIYSKTDDSLVGGPWTNYNKFRQR